MTSTAIVATLRVTRWHPLVIAMAAGALYALLGSKVSAPDRLMAAVAGVAATTAFVIDDPAAASVASTPPSLLVRRVGRVVLVAIPLTAWWAVVVVIASARFGPMPIRAPSLALVGLAAVALAVGAVAASSGLAERDGLAGATASVTLYGLTLVPLPSWSPLPRSPGTPGTASRWLLTAGIALGLFVWTSRDPAGRSSR